MKVAELLDRRRKFWQELEYLCDSMQAGGRKRLGAAGLTRFATLYRAACADLALADAYQLPPSTVQYLHRLVGRAHNQLYRTRVFDFAAWGRTLMVEVPQRVFNDRCVQLMFVLFYGVFLLSAFLAYRKDLWPTYAEDVLSAEMITGMEEMHTASTSGGSNPFGTSAYIWHNTSIGLKCFVSGLLVIPGLFITMFNAATLGAVFRYMARPDVEQTKTFYEFVTAHGPFELTAIVLSAGAGLRLGVSWMSTKGLGRLASLQKTGRETLPVMGSAIIMFALAAITEASLSPSTLPYWVKATVAIVSSGMLTFYFVVLGFPRSDSRAV
ncbi:MAG: stage II sporulation protein M [Planctomycetales bacterium]|nr:stage II sporulation protein M [Planctomycetales bacterium]